MGLKSRTIRKWITNKFFVMFHQEIEKSAKRTATYTRFHKELNVLVVKTCLEYFSHKKVERLKQVLSDI